MPTDEAIYSPARVPAHQVVRKSCPASPSVARSPQAIIHLDNLPNTGHDFSIAAGDRAWRALRPHAPILVAIALVASAAVTIIAASGIRDTTAAVPVPTSAGKRIADDVLLALALALPVACAIAAAILTSRRVNSVSGACDPAGQQAAETRSCDRLKQPPPSRARGGQFKDGIERFVVHAESPSLAQPIHTASRHALSLIS